MSKKKILIVEDEPAIADDLMDILEIQNFQVTGIAYNYDQAISLLSSDLPDLVFLDIALGGRENGLDVANLINEKYKLPFIFLTSFSDTDTINRVAALKPAGYLVKPFREKDIAPIIAVAFANQKIEKSTLFPSLEFINQFLDKELTKQEYKVLDYIWKGKQNNEIASATFTSVNTVKSHTNNIYKKLEVKSRVEAIKKVIDF